MLLATLIVLLFVFVFLGMEIAWAIGWRASAYLVAADVIESGSRSC